MCVIQESYTRICHYGSAVDGECSLGDLRRKAIEWLRENVVNRNLQETLIHCFVITQDEAVSVVRFVVLRHKELPEESN